MSRAKILFSFIVVFVISLAFISCASARVLQFEDVYAQLELDDKYIILLPGELDAHSEWLDEHGLNQQTLLSDWSERGVLMQAWNADSNICIEFTALQDSYAAQYYDVDQQSQEMRAQYRNEYLKGSLHKANGYTYQSAEWKLTNAYGRVLMLKYKYASGEDEWRGFARRTIRNGYTFTIDYKVFGRALRDSDEQTLNKIMKGFSFVQTFEKPETTASKIRLTSTPPAETNTGKFSLEGTGDPGTHLTAVLSRLSSSSPLRLSADTDSKGKFKLDVTLPAEGVWLMTLTVENGTTVTEEMVFEPTTYSATLLPVNIENASVLNIQEEHASEEKIATFDTDTLTIQGTTMPKVKIQCLVNDTFVKEVSSGTTGEFRIKLDTAQEGPYSIILVFQKKGYTMRRFTATVNHVQSEASRRAYAKKNAVKPAYNTLLNKLDGYTGKVMGYSLWVIDIEQSGDEWIVTMAMKKSKAGVYSQFVKVMTTEEPAFDKDTEQKMYGTCTGGYEMQSEEEGTTVYPCFDLLFWE